MKSGQNTASIEEKIEEYEHSLNIAETERSKALARLDKLREGGLPVDDYIENEQAGAGDTLGGAGDWDQHEDDDQHDTTVHHESIEPDWSQTGAGGDWGAPAEEETPAAPYTGEVAQALVLYTFDATSTDELSVDEGDWINVLVTACSEEGWVMGENRAGDTGLVPSSFVRQITPEQYEAELAAESVATTAPLDNWEQPAESAADLAVPSCPPPADETDLSSDEESEDDDDDDGPPPGLAPPPGPAPAPSVNKDCVQGSYQALYDFQSSADDELTIAAGDVITLVREADDEGWYFGSLNGKQGIFPSSYVEKLSGDEAKNVQNSNNIEEEKNDPVKEDSVELKKDTSEVEPSAEKNNDNDSITQDDKKSSKENEKEKKDDANSSEDDDDDTKSSEPDSDSDSEKDDKKEKDTDQDSEDDNLR